MENRRKRWYDLFGLLPRNLGRLLLWFSLIPIAFIIVLLVYAWRADQYELDEVLAPLENCAAYDRNGQWIGTLTDHDRVYVARNELPDNLVNAFIAREDEDFFRTWRHCVLFHYPLHLPESDYVVLCPGCFHDYDAAGAELL